MERIQESKPFKMTIDNQVYDCHIEYEINKINNDTMTYVFN